MLCAANVVKVAVRPLSRSNADACRQAGMVRKSLMLGFWYSIRRSDSISVRYVCIWAELSCIHALPLDGRAEERLASGRSCDH